MPLKRVITFEEALAINIGAIIGAGIFTISGLAAGLAGPGVIFAIIISGIVCILTGFSYAELSHNNPREGGNYEYARDLLGGYAGFLTGITFFVGAIIGGAAVAISFAGYFSGLFGITFNTDLIAALLVIVLGIINYFGVKYSANLSVFLTVIKVIVLVIFVVVGLFFIKPTNYSPFLPSGIFGVLGASAFIFFAYTGFARITTLGEEVENARETIPKTIIYSIIISAVIYTVVIVVMIGIIPYSSVSGSSSPLETAISYATHNTLLIGIISLGALFATINVDLSMILGMSRVAFTMARNNDLPRSFNRLNKYGVPDMAITLSILIMLVAIVSLSFKNIISLSNVAALVSYSIANIAVIKLVLSKRKSQKLFKSKYFVIIPMVGVISTIGLMIFLTSYSLIIMFGIVALVTTYYVLSGKGVDRQTPHP
jgi:APA family basic amino acid/polyamine antiporter